LTTPFMYLKFSMHPFNVISICKVNIPILL
jgi:hypothetical protein